MRSLASLAGLALVCCLFPATATPAAGRPDLVVRAGLSAANTHEDNLTSRARRGPAAGLGTRVRLSHDFFLLPEIWYQQKGFRRGTLWERIDLDYRYHVITAPVLLSLRLPTSRGESRASVGLAVDWVLKSDIFRLDREIWQEVTAQDEKLFFSVVIGGGTRWRNLDFDVRYQHGLTKVTDYDYAEFRDVIPVLHPFDPAYDRTWTLSAGLWF